MLFCLSFSDFVQMLYSHLAGKMLPSEFVLFITTQIMKESYTDTGLENHPLGKMQDDTLTRFYNGTRPLSGKAARIIINHLDRARFEGYLSGLSDDKLDWIRSSMPKDTITIDDDIIDACTNLFVQILEDRVRKIPKPRSAKRDVAFNDTEDEVAPQTNNILPNESKSERMSDIFHDSSEDFDIQDFISSNPIVSLTSDRIRDITNFIGRIRSSENREDILYENINTFIDVLTEYLKFLKANSENPIFFPEGYKPLKGNFRKIVKKSSSYCRRLKSIYRDIEATVEKLANDDLEQLRTTHKEIWVKNTQLGTL